MQNNNQNLPKGWRKVKLGELLLGKPQYGYTASAQDKKIGPKFLRVTDIVGYNVEWSNVPYCSINEKEKKKYILNKHDIVFARAGTVGFTYFFKEEPPEETIFASYLIRIKIDNKKCDPLYLAYFLRSPYYWGQVKGFLSGTSQPGINATSLQDFEVFIPTDINEQKRIAEILSAFDDKIELNNKINKTLEEMASAIFKEWFVKNLKFKNQNAKVLKAESVFIFEKGIEPGSRYYSEVKKDNYVPFYRVRDLDKEGETDVYIPIEITKGKLCKKDDVLLSLDATVGRVKVGCSGAFSSGIRKVYSRDGIIRNSFIYFWLKTPYVQNTILEHASGTTILHAGNSIKYLEFPFEKNIIGKIQVIVEPIFNKILELKVENRKLAALRDLLLPKLMSGEIRV